MARVVRAAFDNGMILAGYPYRWAWRGHDTQRQRTCLRRQGQRCRVVVRGALNSALVEFDDGFRTVTSRNGLRRVSRQVRKP